MAIVVLAAVVVGLFLLRRLARGGKPSITITPTRPYNPNRAQFQRVPGRRRRLRGL